ncbi:hypothetical protein DFJ77DRAFT_439840 [Powellomyces hirtus]|nr:hypothetical protein DFJ77DRAFT_439840 [Powellomyces hirtus]
MACFSIEILENVVDFLWDDIVVHLNTSLFLTLTLVNPRCKAIMYRRRKELMRAQAAAVLCGSFFLDKTVRSNDFFMNTCIPSMALLAQLVSTMQLVDAQRVWTMPTMDMVDRRNDLLEYVLKSLQKHKNRIVPSLETLEQTLIMQTAYEGLDCTAQLAALLELPATRSQKIWLLSNINVKFRVDSTSDEQSYIREFGFLLFDAINPFHVPGDFFLFVCDNVPQNEEEDMSRHLKRAPMFLDLTESCNACAVLDCSV